MQCDCAVRIDRRQPFEDEVKPHLETLLRSAYRLSRNEMDAQDLVQDTLLRAYRFWDRFESGSNCRAWLLRILRNLYINEFRIKSRRPVTVNVDDVEEGVLYYHSIHVNRRPPTPDALLTAQSFDDDLAMAVNTLRDEFRDVILLRFVHDYPYRQIASVIHKNVGTVKSRLFRGRQMLRAKLVGQQRKPRYFTNF